MQGRRILPLVSPALLATCLAVAAWAVGRALTSIDRARAWFVASGWYFTLALLACCAVAAALAWREAPPAWAAAWSRHRVGLVLAVVLAALASTFVPHRLRVLNDELQLLSVARTMTLRHEARMEREVWTRNPSFETESWVDKRPLVFPFLIGATHAATGYRLENVFALNAVLLAGFLFALWCLVRRHVSARLSAAALLLVTAQPIVPLCATSGGYETCYLLLLACALLALRHFLDAPSGVRFQLLVFVLLAFANVQYTAVLLLVVALAVLVALGYVERRFVREGWLLPLAPAFLLPVAWQRIIMARWSDPSFPAGSTASAFGWTYLVHNVEILPEHFFSLTARSGLAGAVNLAGVFALVLLALAWSFHRRPVSRAARAFGLALGGYLGATLAILLLYYSGMDGHAMNGRLYIAFVVVLSVSPVLLADALVRERPGHGGGLLLAAAAVALLAYSRVAVQDHLFRRGQFVQELDFLARYWKEHPLRNSLVIYKMSQELAPFRNDAINMRTAHRWRDLVVAQRDRHVYDRIYVVQGTYCQSGLPFRPDTFDLTLPLRTVAETTTTPGACLRVSLLE